MLICPQCRFENPLSNRFCQVCGAQLADSPDGSRPDRAEDQAVPLTLPSLGEQPPDSPNVNDPWAEISSLVAATEAMDAFATIPPSSASYHQSLELPTADGEAGDAIASSPSPGLDPSPGPASHEPVNSPAPLETSPGDFERDAAIQDLPEGLAAAALPPELLNPRSAEPDGVNLPGAEAWETAEPSEVPEETWDESTVWTGPDMDRDRGGDDSPTVVLPMQLARLESAGFSHVGRQREHNEDNFEIQTEIISSSGLMGQSFAAKGLYILCDGMGGHSGGEVASAMVVAELKRYFAEHWQGQLPNEATIRAAIASANHVVYDANESDERSGNGRMGTTLVLVLIQGTQVAFAHVGDSRLYTYSRRQGLIQRTVDHEVGQLEVMRGVDPEIAYGRPESYQLTQALGPKDDDYLNPDVEEMDLQEDMLFLLCSDGLSDYSLVEDHVEEKVAPLLSSQIALEQGVNELVHLANELSGHDNITAVAIRAKVRPDVRALGD